ncbi:MAG TPA: serpin family protein, partial [Puia sp.]
SDFSNMYGATARKACISQIFHQTHLRVNEDGMVASTAGEPQGIAATASEKASLRELRFNRPFVYFLMEKQRNLMLMTGIVNDPSLIVQPAPVSKKPTAPHHRSRRKHHSRRSQSTE